MFHSDNPVMDFERYDASRERKLQSLPKCTECGEHIQQTDALYINNGYICDNCLEDLRRELLSEW